MKWQQISKLLFLLFAFGVINSGCNKNEEEENEVIVEADEGEYIEGSATVFDSYIDESVFGDAFLEKTAPEEAKRSVLGLYTWLKAGGELFITKVDRDGKARRYGRGSTVSKSLNTYSLGNDNNPFTVEEDGLYKLLLNNAENQLSIYPAEFGYIGNATQGLWDREIPFDDVFFNDDIVTFRSDNVFLRNKQIKFRYANDWLKKIPFADTAVKFYSNIGLDNDEERDDIRSSPSVCVPEGQNFTVPESGNYDIEVKFYLKSKVFTASATLKK